MDFHLSPGLRPLFPFLRRCDDAGPLCGAAQRLVRQGLALVALGLLGACDDAPPKVAAVAVPTPAPAKAGPALPPAPVPAVQAVPPPAPLPAAATKKLAAPLLQALELSQRPQAAGQPAAAMPGIPIQHEGRVLVDLEADVSQDLLDQIAKVGGLTAPHPAPGRQLRVFIPLAELEVLAARADVTAIAVATVTSSGGMKAAPAPPPVR